jgi:D-lactate dehydrogenase
MKLLMYTARKDEEVNLKKLEQQFDMTIDSNKVPLNADTVALAEGYDAVCVQQHADIKDEIIYQRLADFGIKHIALRITGYEIVNFTAAQKYGITITNVPAYSPRSVSELVLADVMALLRHLKVASCHANHQDFSWRGLESREIHNLTVGIIGAGKIGSAVARIFKALGARVIVSDPIQRPELFDTVEYVDYSYLLSNADVVTMHTPLTDEMYHFMNYACFKQMKSNAIFINASRGPVVDTEALVSALQMHEIAGAAIDTFEGEAGITSENLTDRGYDNPPLQSLLAMDNVIVTPHIGFYTNEAVANMDAIATTDVIRLLNGKVPLHPVNEV